MALEILVLAAGQGKRMRSQLPKILHPLAGRPLLAHVLASARTREPRKVVVVHGHGAEAVRAAFADADVVWLAVGEKLAVRAVKVEAAWEVAGVNSKRELAELERHFQKREALRLLEEGVTLADPARIDVRGELTCGNDVAIDVNCVFEG